MSRIALGKDELGREVRLDLDRLVTTKLLVQANSGGGKSWTVRRILEQSHGKIQHVVLDPEGEFATLREKFDYVLVGKGGDIAADVRYAPKLAERLLELGTSAIIDLYELRPEDRRAYVAVFLPALVNLPKELWHPCIVVVGEAHTFCPEPGRGRKGQKSASGDAVIELASLGRKRGYCAILDTQRISKLHADARAECQNRLIGLSVMDLDYDRAAEELGWHRNDARNLRNLEPGDFYAFGPAISREVQRVKIGPVQTSHPEVGTRAGRLRLASPPPPPEKVRAILSKLADLPKEAEEERQTVDSLRRRVRELEVEARQRQTVKVPETRIERVEVAVLKDNQITRLERVVGGVEKAAANFTAEAQLIRAAVAKNSTTKTTTVSSRLVSPPPKPTATQRQPTKRQPEDSNLSGPERKLLSVLAQYPQGRMVTQIALLSGYAKDGGAFRNPLGSLRSRGFVEGKDVLRATAEGLDSLGEWEPLPAPGRDLLVYWMWRLAGPEREIVRVLSDAWPDTLTAQEVAARSLSSKGEPYDPDGGAFRNPLGRLRTLELVQGRGNLKLNDDLMR